MRFSVSSSDLLKKLQVTGGAIGSNPVLPILEDFLFTIKGNQLIITATDLETAITTQMDVEADKDGSVAVPAKILLETLKALPQQPITVEVDESNFNIEITSSYGKYKLAGENGEEFPTIPEAEGPAALSIPDDACHYHSSLQRTLTVREMARFQSFPDKFEFRSKVTTGGKMRKFEVPQYTQVGNAVPPLLGRALGLVVKNILSLR